MIPSIHSVDERLGDNEGGELSVNQRGANRVIIIGKVVIGMYYFFFGEASSRVKTDNRACAYVVPFLDYFCCRN